MESNSRNRADKSHKSEAKRDHRGERPAKTGSARRGAKAVASAPTRGPARGAVGFVRSLPKTIGAQLRAHPPEALAAVGAASFALGAVLGSRLGRLLLAVAVPFALKSALGNLPLRHAEAS
jgi:hypothetical protein